MLLTRVLTAVVLLILLLAVLYSESFLLFLAVAAAFTGAAMWESARLFKLARPLLQAVLWSLVFLALASQADSPPQLLFILCVLIWAMRFAPALGFGLPPADGAPNRLLSALYSVALIGCFVAVVVLYQYSALYLVSVLALVWLADIGAYFAGKAFGRRKLAPSISPGKSWEGAIGGWMLVLGVAGFSLMHPWFDDTFAARVQASLGWAGLVSILTLVVAASVVGDLFESQLKRRVGAKDSSALLPGHGGVLDRIDALVPVLPLAVLVTYWL